MIEEIKNLNNLTNKIKYDYKDIFYEETKNKNYIFLNSKIDNVITNYINGVSLTLKINDTDYFLSSNKISELTKEYLELEKILEKQENKNIEIKYNEYLTDKSHDNFSNEDKLKLMKYIDSYCRDFDKKINQVKVTLIEKFKTKYILNDNILKKEEIITTRLAVIITAEENGNIVSSSYAPGYNNDYSFIDYEILQKNLESTCSDLLEKLVVVPYAGGKVPVIINSGFGAVLFHEACGHAMESYSIVNNTSILTGKLNKKIATDKVTIIDDGTIKGEFGTQIIDDQGVKTNKNILIENGILKNYLTDINDAKKLGTKSTGSARRENYNFKAISRMNNTYLEIGEDSFEDMLKSIKNGMYAKNLGGGSVDPNTGRFNFFVSFGYIIEDGKLTKPIKDVTLIGSIFEVLDNVEMVSNDQDLSTGMCGAESGWVTVTCGQPTIKLKEILVGGNKNE